MRDSLTAIFVLLSFANLVMTIVGLINPADSWFRHTAPTRKLVALGGGGVGLLLFVVGFVVAPPHREIVRVPKFEEISPSIQGFRTPWRSESIVVTMKAVDLADAVRTMAAALQWQLQNAPQNKYVIFWITGPRPAREKAPTFGLKFRMEDLKGMDWAKAQSPDIRVHDIMAFDILDRAATLYDGGQAPYDTGHLGRRWLGGYCADPANRAAHAICGKQIELSELCENTRNGSTNDPYCPVISIPEAARQEALAGPVAAAVPPGSEDESDFKKIPEISSAIGSVDGSVEMGIDVVVKTGTIDANLSDTALVEIVKAMTAAARWQVDKGYIHFKGMDFYLIEGSASRLTLEYREATLKAIPWDKLTPLGILNYADRNIASDGGRQLMGLYCQSPTLKGDLQAFCSKPVE